MSKTTTTKVANLANGMRSNGETVGQYQSALAALPHNAPLAIKMAITREIEKYSELVEKAQQALWDLDLDQG